MKYSICLLAIIVNLVTGCFGRLDEKPPLKPVITKSTEFMLSFDDGPLPDATERVLLALTMLKAVDGSPVKAGFFLLADAPDGFWRQRLYYAPYEFWSRKGSIAKYPAIARRIKQAGHTIGNHTAHHAWFRWPWLDTPEAVLSEVAEWEAVSKTVLGTAKIRLFRPPYLVVNTNVRAAANRLGYQIVTGEPVADTLPGITVAMIKQNTQSILSTWSKPYPCLLIFHDNRPATYLHLGEIVSNLQRRGFQLVHFDPKRL